VLSLIDRQLPLQPLRKTFSWFHSDEAKYNFEVFPVWTFDNEESTYYGFPSFQRAEIKIGRHDGGIPVAANEKLRPFGSMPEDKLETTQFANTYMSRDTLKEGKVCT